ncbi:MAG: radical SAM protein [Syntrophorhabdales bacterium]
MAIITKYLTFHKLNHEYTLLVNSLSGAVDIVDNNAKETIESLQQGLHPENAKDIDLITTLRMRGYIFESEGEELAVLQKYRLIDQSSNEKDDRVKFVICPTMTCNLRCTYCFESHESRHDSRIMAVTQLDNIFQIIDQVISERKPAIASINLFGGEPLLPSTHSINKKIFEHAAARKLSVYITTNGTHIRNYIELIKRYQPDTQPRFQITLDGVKEVHDRRRFRSDNTGTFEEICSGIDCLLAIGSKVDVRVNLDRENIDHLKEFIEFIAAKGWSSNDNFYCDIAPVSDHHSKGSLPNLMPENEILRKIGELFPDYWDNEKFFRLLLFRVLHHINNVVDVRNKMDNFLRFHYCEANRLQFYVFCPDGYIYACPESAGNKECRIGTFDTKMELSQEQIQKWQGRDVLRIPKCRNCKVALFCGGGCAMAAININNNIDDPVCNNAEELLAEYIQGMRRKIISKYC